MDKKFSLPTITRFILQGKKKASRKALYFTVLSLAYTIVLNAQATTDKVQMADGMRSSGKIYVVVAVLLTVLTGLILYLVRLDKKIARLENKSGN